MAEILFTNKSKMNKHGINRNACLIKLKILKNTRINQTSVTSEDENIYI